MGFGSEVAAEDSRLYTVGVEGSSVCALLSLVE